MMNSSSSAPYAGLRLSLMMFLQFFVWGAWYVSTGPYMDANGMADGIAWAYTVGPIAAIVSPFFLGMVADRYFSSERVLGTLHVLGGIVLMAAPLVQRSTAESFGYWPFVAVLGVHMLCYMPTLGLTNTVAFHAMTAPEKQFPLVRVFGTIGWIVANLVISLAGADRSDLQFYIAGASGVALGLYSFSLPHTPPPSRGQAFSARSALGLDALGLLRDRSFLVFSVCSFLVCIPLAAYYAFGGTFVGEMGVEKVAATMSLGQVSEILFMLVMPLCFAALGVKWMLAVGMLAWVGRYLLFSWAAVPDAPVMWAILVGILLHGICYDFFFVTGQIYVERSAAPRIRASAQGFLVLITQGLGMLVGAQVGGWLFARYVNSGDGEPLGDWRTFWLVPAIFAGAVMLVFLATFRNRPISARDVEEAESTLPTEGAP